VVQPESEAQCVQAITTAVNRELPNVSARLKTNLERSAPEQSKPASAQNARASLPAVSIFSLRIDSTFFAFTTDLMYFDFTHFPSILRLALKPCAM